MGLPGCTRCISVDQNHVSLISSQCTATPNSLQILTQEDWNMVLFNGMAQTTPWAALYFVLLMTFGNYVLFNLLVAILVEGFQESKEEERKQQVLQKVIEFTQNNE